MKSTSKILVVVTLLTFGFKAYSIERSSESADNGTFEIYITKSLITWDYITDYSAINLDTIELNENPFLTTGDIEYYDSLNHIIYLNKSRDSLNFPYSPPVNGQMFVVVANGERVYCGFFWAYYSSTSCNWVVINIAGLYDNQISIELGYPGEIDFQGTDPRNNPVVLDALEKNGLLTNIRKTKAASIKMYPNPTNGILNVSGLNSMKNASVLIYNEAGKLLRRNTSSGSKINLSNNSPGVYYLQLYTDKKLAGTFKIVKL